LPLLPSDAAHGFLGDRRFRRRKHLEESPTGMSKAGDMRHPRRLIAANTIQRAVTGIGIG
jgi:hypothetical protein